MVARNDPPKRANVSGRGDLGVFKGTTLHITEYLHIHGEVCSRRVRDF